MSVSKQDLEQARRYMDSMIAIDRESGYDPGVPHDLYERLVARVAATTHTIKQLTERAKQD